VKAGCLPTVALALDASLGQPDGGYPRHGLEFIHKKSSGDAGTGFWQHIEAGYGQFCQLESGFAKTGMELEQPSCAYLKARFSF
jgi:hypothetical protein